LKDPEALKQVQAIADANIKKYNLKPAEAA